MISIILIDDHELFRLGVRGVLERFHSDIQIVAEAETGKELFELLPCTEADVVLLDINLPDMSGIDIARRLRSDYPALKILAVSAENNAETVRALLDIGIDGFISKRMARADEMLQAIHSVVGGLDYFGRDIASIIYEIYVAKKKTFEPTAEFGFAWPRRRELSKRIVAPERSISADGYFDQALAWQIDLRRRNPLW